MEILDFDQIIPEEKNPIDEMERQNYEEEDQEED